MAQEDKKLLFKDLCARLPYVLYCNITDYTAEREEDENFDAPLLSIERTESGGYATFRFVASEYKIWNNKTQLVKPYLRPMSSMTEDENKEAKENGCIIYRDTSPEDKGLLVFASPKGFDWLNQKMPDYRKDDEGKTMIERGLALEAPKRMYD